MRACDLLTYTRAQGDRVIVLRNMVDAADVDDELEDEVADECEQFGKVDRVVVWQVRESCAYIRAWIYVLFKCVRVFV